MVKNKGKVRYGTSASTRFTLLHCFFSPKGLADSTLYFCCLQGGKNRRRGKADGDMKRELTFKEDGQGT